MKNNCCNNDSVDISVLQKHQRTILLLVLLINAMTFIMMITAARYSGSSSLLSGALDNFGDALTYATEFCCNWFG